MSESDLGFVERMANTAKMKMADRARLLSLARRGAETQWRPIEEAPKDETLFVLVSNGHWKGLGRYFEPGYDEDPPWLGEDGEYIVPDPTHFIPLSALGEPSDE